MTDAEKIEKLVAQCLTYHDALDMAFVLLIAAVPFQPPHKAFFPSQSPMWPVMVAGKTLVDTIEAETHR